VALGACSGERADLLSFWTQCCDSLEPRSRADSFFLEIVLSPRGGGVWLWGLVAEDRALVSVSNTFW
jgi:hypothetical protein